MLDEYNSEMNKLVRLQKLLGQCLNIENFSTTNEQQIENNLDSQHHLFERIVEQKQRVSSMYTNEEFLPSFEEYNSQMSVLIQMQNQLNNCLPTNEIEQLDDEEPNERTKRLFDNMVKQSKLV